MAKRDKRKKRDRSGKLLRPTTREGRVAKFDHGNDWVQRRAALFAIFERNDRPLKPEEHSDGPGQAYLAGLFDNLGADPLALRDAARDFGALYWCYFANMGAKTANLTGAVSGRGGTGWRNGG